MVEKQCRGRVFSAALTYLSGNQNRAVEGASTSCLHALGSIKGLSRAQQHPRRGSSCRSNLLALQRTLQGAIIGAILMAGTSEASAQATPTLNSARANANTVGVISGGADGTYIRIAADLANVLDGNELRLLPIIGRGSLQNLRDIMFLRGVDIGIVQMDALEELKSDNLYSSAVNRLRYIARLYNEEVHIIADRTITDIRQLQGKKVNIDKAGSGTNLTARIIFSKLGIRPEFTTFDQGSSYQRLRSGEIQAAIYVAGRPVRAIAEFQSEAKFHLLPIPFEGGLTETYLPAQLSQADYPHLVDGNRPVDTVAVGSVLAAFNWPKGSERYRRLTNFVNAFFSRFDEFQQPGRHAKWKEVNLAATTPGWERFGPAEEWLQRTSAVQASSDQVQKIRGETNNQGRPPSAAEREALFQEFLAWRSRRQQGGLQREAR